MPAHDILDPHRGRAARNRREPNAVRRRIVITALAATLAVTGLAGCRTNVGVAARVAGDRITESDVNGYLAPGGVDPSLAAQAKTQGQQVIPPRTQVLQFLIQEKVFEKTLDDLGVRPTPGQLAASHDAAARLLLHTQLTGAALDAAIDKQLPSSGIKKSFRPTFLRVEELEYTLIQKRKLTQLSELVTLIKQAKISVSVNPRYGKWIPNQLSLDGKPVVPPYLSVQPTPGAGASSQPGG
jgi:hypothetical protein